MRLLAGLGLVVSWVLCGCGADVGVKARSTAARDLSCAQRETRIVDHAVGLYRVRGCGMEATYRCEEDRRTLAMRCHQVAAYKLEEAAPKQPQGQSLAKDAE